MSTAGDKVPPHDGDAAGQRPVAGRATDQPAERERALAERERQLRDLTEQSLGLLEELAEARRQLLERHHLAERVAELERRLGHATASLRHAGGYAPTAGADAEAPPLEVVYWGKDAIPAAAQTRRSMPDLAVVWVGPPGALAEAGDLPDDVRWFAHRDAHTFAQCWNLAMAATRAASVLFLGPRSRLAAPPDPAPLTVDPGAVMLAPRIRRPDGDELGQDEIDGALHLRAHGAGTAAEHVAFPCSDAFVVRRAVFERVGMFDEDLLGPAALFDYVLRARDHNYHVLGLPDLAIDVDAGTEPYDDPAFAVERLQVLATHRPDELANELRELAAGEALWAQGPEAAASSLARLVAHLRSGGPVDARGVLLQLTQGLVRRTVPIRTAIAALQQWRDDLLGALERRALPDQLPAVQAARARAAGERHASFEAAIEALGRDAATLAEVEGAARAALAAATADRERAQVELAEQQADGERTRARLRELEAELAELRQRHEQATRNEAAAAQRLAGLQQEVAAVREHAAAEQRAAAAEHQRLEARQQDLERRLAAAQGTLREREHWIGLLLREVVRRRWLPRPLSEHERTFLEQLDGRS